MVSQYRRHKDLHRTVLIDLCHFVPVAVHDKKAAVDLHHATRIIEPV
jgi:hypothetical protein